MSQQLNDHLKRLAIHLKENENYTDEEIKQVIEAELEVVDEKVTKFNEIFEGLPF